MNSIPATGISLAIENDWSFTYKITADPTQKATSRSTAQITLLLCSRCGCGGLFFIGECEV